MLIGLTGKAGSGKDTVADIMVQELGFRKVGFADALYREVSAFYGISEDQLRNRFHKESPDNRINRLPDNRHIDMPFPLSPRQVLQWWGTEYRRAQNEHYWIDKMVITEHPTVIPDVRFHNEADFIHAHFGTILKIERPGIPNVNPHVSEQQEIEARFVLSNDGSKQDLSRTIHSLINVLSRTQKVRG